MYDFNYEKISEGKGSTRREVKSFIIYSKPLDAINKPKLPPRILIQNLPYFER